MISKITMTHNKAATILAAIVVVASLMIGASVMVALINQGMGIQQANAAPRRVTGCPPQTGHNYPPCGPPLRAR